MPAVGRGCPTSSSRIICLSTPSRVILGYRFLRRSWSGFDECSQLSLHHVWASQSVLGRDWAPWAAELLDSPRQTSLFLPFSRLSPLSRPHYQTLIWKGCSPEAVHPIAGQDVSTGTAVECTPQIESEFGLAVRRHAAEITAVSTCSEPT